MNSAEIYRKVRFSEVPLHEYMSDELWESLAHYANDNLVLADLASHVNSRDMGCVSNSEVRNLFEASITISQEIAGEIERESLAINRILRTVGVKAVFLKGAAIMLAGYEQYPGTRLVSDIDILVTRQDLDACIDALEDANYFFQINLSRPASSYWTTKHLPPLIPTHGTWSLEVHIAPLSPSLFFGTSLTSENLLSRAQAIRKGGAEVLIPSDKDMMFHSFHHSAINDLYLFLGIDMIRSYLDLRYMMHRNCLDELQLTELLNAYSNRNSRVFASITKAFVNRVSWMICDTDCQATNGSGRSALWILLSRARGKEIVQRSLHRLLYGLRGMIYLSSRNCRIERSMLLKANPDNFKFLPLWKQFLNPAIIQARIAIVRNKIR